MYTTINIFEIANQVFKNLKQGKIKDFRLYYNYTKRFLEDVDTGCDFQEKKLLQIF